MMRRLSVFAAAMFSFLGLLTSRCDAWNSTAHEAIALMADDQMSPEEAVKAYHAALGKLGIRPLRALADDLQKTETVSAYSGTASPGRKPPPKSTPASTPKKPAGTPDFEKMTPAEKVQWNLDRWKRIVG